MLDKKALEESKSIIQKLVRDGKIINPPLDQKSFFLAKAINSLQISKRLLKLAEEENLDTYMWVINTSYYSMFFATICLLAHFNKKIKSEIGIHKLTYHALVYYFVIEDNKLQKHFIEEYKDTYDDAEQMLQITEEKAISLIENFKFEHVKREQFTYDVGRVAEKNKATTSAQRAEEFLTQIRLMLR
jgi:uncharacterized protein (UPF0332 family)